MIQSPQGRAILRAAWGRLVMEATSGVGPAADSVRMFRESMEGILEQGREVLGVEQRACLERCISRTSTIERELLAALADLTETKVPGDG